MRRKRAWRHAKSSLKEYKMHLTYRKTCRVCGSPALTPVIDLGDQHLQGSFLKKGISGVPLRKIKCSLVRCDPMRDERACGLLQMERSVPPEILYSSYWYRSGTNETMRSHLSGIARSALEMTGIGKDGSVLDIGCNDGTLLKAYPPSLQRFGVDPSDVAQGVGDGITVVQDVFPSPELTARRGGRSFDVITSIAMFYDLESPVNFVHEIRKSLAPEGLWIFEMSYMPSMLEMNSYDTICHEHLEYYSLSVVENILRRAQMKVVKVELNPINGGSIRCYAVPEGCFKYPISGGVRALRQKEFDLELDTDKPYKNFQSRIEAHRVEIQSVIRSLLAKGRRIHAYGASTKGNTILQWCGIDGSMIECASDRNPDKFGASTIGTGIRIVSEEESRRLKPDYYFVLPWHFADEFIAREKDLLMQGIGMIFPLPEIHVVRMVEGNVVSEPIGAESL